ncbi:RNA polymerase sigma-B factor [Andreesenia angusta]|jgi:RNA polymerase sigma-B factor|uniref:RNA polymerase sigma-B factor n=1 Tax=Andreesenia angusta TaxID=39480 RepID=A0A1S1V3K1_9FIRM|nr:SigB/SigF/SigG family RNA polymerase sigma factor [Andreesenia angusta]OHW61291.1 RNA polymerase sigma-B factor [Andreesenia angusta]
MGNSTSNEAKEKLKIKKDSKELFRKYAETKNIDVREELISRYMYIAEILSKKYANKGIDYDDIYQVACIGLIYAVDRFDIDKGYEFSSFATPTIIGEIKKYFRDKGWAIRVPRRIQELSQKVNLAKTTLSQELQRAPNVYELAEYLNSTPEEVLEVMEASKVYTPQSLDISYESDGDDKEISLSDLIGEEDKQFLKIENNDFLSKTIEKLNRIEKQIISDRYFNKKTQIEIANDLGISQMTVSRMEKKIIEKFKRELEKTNS